jgi:NAD+ synthase (glutamine-hydrolysing)
VRLALCQINATVGDIAGNAALIAAGVRAAASAGADLTLFGELALTGYPPEDLLLRDSFLRDARGALDALAADVRETTAVVGFPEAHAGNVYNAAAVLRQGAVAGAYRKLRLPNYGVFDEQRYFTPGHEPLVIDVAARRVGVTVCEDLWSAGAPAALEAAEGAELLVNISASPYHAGKGAERERIFGQRAREHDIHVAFCGLVGGQDELVFDGHSFVVDPSGSTIARACQFSEDMLVCDLPGSGEPRAQPLHEPLAPQEAEVYAALTLGLRDYVHKNGFTHVVLGLSGGVDSALVACLAVDALGPERVSVAIMPSPYSSETTQSDARELATRLGLRGHELAIEPIMTAYRQALAQALAQPPARQAPAPSSPGAGGSTGGAPGDLTEQNLQARIRGNLLMALSNHFGWLVLTTGNKSEMSVGYTTLYGDLAGGFAVIKDVPKTLVYRLCEWRNSPAGAAPGPVVPLQGSAGARGQRASAPIPQSVLTRAPSAELRPDQRDEDSLPPYELLDQILHGYIELKRSREELEAQGLARVEETIRLVDRAEYKRRQAPPGVKVTSLAFGRDRRMPITNRYRHG